MAAEPREFGPYRLIRRLGVGGMAETFEAARLGDGGFEQRVCLKRVLPAFGDDEDFVARFQKEARLAAQLRHTHIVGIIDAGQVDGAHYMALELVDGVDLRSLLRSSPGEKLDHDTVALIAIDLAYAFEHAHATLVHRDVSPSNILLSRTGEAKLADFGIAKAIENAKVTASRTAKGKIPYMAPEQMRGASVDGRADLFSLGVVMFEAVAGVRPFDGAHDVETMQRVLEGRRLRLEEVAPRVPTTLRRIIDGLLVIDRDARTQTAHDLLDQLAEVAPPPSVRRALATCVESHRGGPFARLHVRAREEERDTELTRLPKALEPEPPAKQSGNRHLVLAFASVLGLTAAGAVGANFANRPAGAVADSAARTGTDASTDADAGTETAADTGTGTAAGTDTDAPAGTQPEAALLPAKGFVYVIVEPWGNVWIDGKFLGRAPVKARLGKGRHVVEAGRELPSQKRVVRVQPGARKEVQLTLGAE